MDKRTRSGQPSRHPGVRERDGRCQISYTDSNGRRKQTLTRFPYNEAGIASATKERNRLIRGGENGKKAPTFGELAQIWLDSPDHSPSYRKSAKGILNKYWMPEFGGVAVDAISYAQLLPAFRKTQHLAPKTRKNILAAARSVFSLACESDFIKTNPAAQFGKLKAPSKEIDPFTREERDRILEGLSGNYHLFYGIRFYLGLRPGEVIALDWSDFSPDLKTVTISRQVVIGKQRSQTKTGKSRVVSVHHRVRALLKEHPSRFAGGPVFVNQYGNPYKRYFWFAVEFNETLKRLGIRYRSPYNVRHTAATMMLRATRDPLWVAQQLGNSVEMIYRHYAGVIHEDRDDEMRKRVEEYL